MSDKLRVRFKPEVVAMEFDAVGNGWCVDVTLESIHAFSREQFDKLFDIVPKPFTVGDTVLDRDGDEGTVVGIARDWVGVDFGKEAGCPVFLKASQLRPKGPTR